MDLFQQSWFEWNATRMSSASAVKSNNKEVGSSSVNLPPITMQLPSTFKLPEPRAVNSKSSHRHGMTSPRQSNLLNSFLHATTKDDGNHTPSSTTPLSNLSAAAAAAALSLGLQPPPACGARQLSKLKRFLNTLMQFGSDINVETGKRVRKLVLGLVNSSLSIEEFHNKLQETTNCPLRPFVVPFLRANLPLLQRELIHCAHLAKQSPSQFLAGNETTFLLEPSFHANFEAPALIPTSGNIDALLYGHLLQYPSAGNGTRHLEKDWYGDFEKVHTPGSGIKRRAYPNGLSDLDLGARAPKLKRCSSLSPNIPDDTTSNNSGRAASQKLHSPSTEASSSSNDSFSNKVSSASLLHFTDAVDANPQNVIFRTSTTSSMDQRQQRSPSSCKDWQTIDSMLSSIAHLVNTTQRAVGELQTCVAERKRIDSIALENSDDVISIRQKTDEAISEIKRQSLLDVEKAVALAEKKASELLLLEGAKFQTTLIHERQRICQEINHQVESTETCWNCGRKASETCSGCSSARYCGSFCQHRDWERHQKSCAPREKAESKAATITTSISTTAAAIVQGGDFLHKHNSRASTSHAENADDSPIELPKAAPQNYNTEMACNPNSPVYMTINI